jgi:hypothetical protein
MIESRVGADWRIDHQLDWLDHDGVVMLRENRTLRAVIADDDDVWTLVFDTVLVNVSAAPLDLGSPATEGREGAGYGGLFWRAPRSFTGGTVRVPGASGGEELQGTRATWISHSGRHDETGRYSTVLLMEGQGNLGAPNQWFVRTEEFAALGFSSVHTLEIGGEASFHYAIVIADGQSDESRCAQLAEFGEHALQ